MEDIIKGLWKHIDNPEKGLPEEVFRLVASLTPMVNVDLLIHDVEGRVLLSWRDDVQCGNGWHVPGGIVRYKETREQRIVRTALTELGTAVAFDKEPVLIKDIMTEQTVRGHFITFVYRCYLPRGFRIDNGGKGETETGYLKWHKTFPENMVRGQRELYAAYERRIEKEAGGKKWD